MLHAKFQDQRTSGSGETIFKGFTTYGHGGHLGQVTWTIYTNFRYPFSRRLHVKFGIDRSSGFRCEDFFNIVDDDNDHNNDGYTMSSPMSLRLRWAKYIDHDSNTIQRRHYYYHPARGTT